MLQYSQGIEFGLMRSWTAPNRLGRQHAFDQSAKGALQTDADLLDPKFVALGRMLHPQGDVIDAHDLAPVNINNLLV